jgi:hypothetical protein
MTYGGYRINRVQTGRSWHQFIAVRGNVALVEVTEAGIQARIDKRAKYDAWEGNLSKPETVLQYRRVR